MRNGVRTMRELAAKDYEWFIRLLVNKELDDEGFHLSQDIQHEYEKKVHNAELLASGKVLVKAYFSGHAPRAAPKGISKRAVNAVFRLNMETMDILYKLSEEDLAKVRNMGQKSLEITLLMRENINPKLRRRGNEHEH